MSEYDVAAAAVVRAGRRLVAAGLVVGSGGNLSVRVGDRLVVTPAASWLDELDPVNLSLTGLDGVVLDGPAPTSELPLHLAAYRARPDAAAVVHAHPQGVLALSALGRVPVLATTDHAYYVGSLGTVPFLPPGSVGLATAAAEQLRDHACVVLARHGISAVGGSMDEALKRALNLEEAARLTLMAACTGAELPAAPAEVWAWVSEIRRGNGHV
jgi:L-fuculose-phosphate aldolase